MRAENFLLLALQQIADQQPLSAQGRIARIAMVQYDTVYGDRCFNISEQGPSLSDSGTGLSDKLPGRGA